MNDSEPHHLLLYDYVPDIAERRAPHREAHLARIREEQVAGRILLAGALGDPPNGGAFVFRGASREEIERFAAEDPYTRAGLVPSHRIEVWKLV